ncbi:arginyl-tRNA synthetase [Halodesulfurarchaeum formicicum]|uniref:Arginine--tRNA ligase n=1 Tax=Halodesulfurarchaeum formicicum TaxID=1873524 RepID=A0A1D8S6G7_9EURY|nr:arginine--tRNA ligase [Halodesulfurarchaeum formicicum]AOW80962.1 arginyl-tRNA synthetase [Halodesulfurarchaeum formicicum]APE96298.1 arginyl-tRNA synthetase [Halodesulfurarchaeum formicicum]
MLIDFREEVESALAGALDSLDLPGEDLGIETPPEDVSAILASSVAFRLAGVAERPPPAVAEDIAAAIDATDLTYVGSVDTQGPYVNFHPAEAYYEETLDTAQSASYGHRPEKGESVVVEHTSANPTGPVHVGRARNPILGDAIARIMDLAGYDVDTHYYVNDAGRQIAVFTWAYETFEESELPEPERDSPEYEMVRYYRRGNTFLEEGPEEEVEAAEAEIQSLMQGLERGDETAYERVSEVVDTVLAGMQRCLERLPATFEEFVKETRFIKDGSTESVATRLQESGLAYEDEGAWHLDLADRGFEKDLVFMRSDGTSLYTTRDLAHHEWKFENYDRAVTVLGEDHKLQARQLQAALDVLGKDPTQLTDVIYSYVNLPTGKMSTRAGTGVDLDDLLDEAVDRAREAVESRMGDRIRDDELTESDVTRIAEQVGIGAVRYDIVSKQPSKPITFKWDDALDFEGQSAPYVQYAHARTCGIVDEAADTVAPAPDASLLGTEAERELLERIAAFPARIEESAQDLEPHTIATYARELADAVNVFYRECPVLGDGVDPDRSAARLALVVAARNTLANALSALGIAAPESM